MNLKVRSKKKIRFQKFTGNIKFNDCPISRASTELMLDRFCNGRDLEFPFLK